MELINQHTKAIMEGCKARASAAGLVFEEETLEYIVTNRDLLELGPKNMIPTLYDYWVNDVELLREKGRYELYPGNPYETVINTRPAISFYNDNNPDWLNVMIFYHVLAHIDFFQNNLFFARTWNDDFNGRALADKRLIAKLRADKGRRLDYVIEFARGMDNLVGYFRELSRAGREGKARPGRLDYYFDVFLQRERKVPVHDYLKEVDRYNALLKKYTDQAERLFFAEVIRDYPEFEALYAKSGQERKVEGLDAMDHVLEHSAFLNRSENRWMKSVIQVVRDTSVFFQPQIRTKIMNEGWASYWHDRLFLTDDRIRGHEVDYARVNAGVTAMPRVGLNPYALGMKLFEYMEEASDKGRYRWDFQKVRDHDRRRAWDAATGEGLDLIFQIRRELCDFTFVNRFLDQDFLDRNKLFVAGRRLNRSRMVWEYFVRSRRVEDYREMILHHLYHPPFVQVDTDRSVEGLLYLDHRFEGKPLLTDFIPAVLMGIEYLWGNTVKLETSELVDDGPRKGKVTDDGDEDAAPRELKFRRVVYTMKNRKLTKTSL